MKLRKLNEEGLRVYCEFLQEARIDSSKMSNIPHMLLTLALTSEEITGAPELERLSHPTSSFELARYLNKQFIGLDQAVIEGKDGRGDSGFWAATSLCYFDLLFAGSQRVLADNCYIPELGTNERLRFFRHRVAGPYRLYKLYGELSEPLLLSGAGAQSGPYSTITDSFFYTETRCVIEALYVLYFDQRNHKLKAGWNSKDKPGALSRLLAVVDQFDLTYDLQGINGEQLLTHLPEEFDGWQIQI